MPAKVQGWFGRLRFISKQKYIVSNFLLPKGLFEKTLARKRKKDKKAGKGL
jgi:hypothetical protein